MITAEEAKKYRKEYVPSEKAQAILNEMEKRIKAGERHPRVFTTELGKENARDLAEYCCKLGYNAYIEDIYSIHGVRGGHYLRIDL